MFIINGCIILFLFVPQIVQKEREERLAQILKDRLNQHVQNKAEFIDHAAAEVTGLSNAGNSYCLHIIIA